MIPKIIHLTWFSGDPYPKDIQDCMDTWKKLLPDFEIKLWDMKMARDLNIPYVNEALDAKKWAFAGDVVRAYAVWEFGGVYMDTDIFLKKRFDEFMNLPMVFFIEINYKNWRSHNPEGAVDEEGHCLMPDTYIKGRQIQAAMFLGEKNHWALKEIVDYYKKQHFLREDGSLNTGLVSPIRYAKVLERHGFLYADKDQMLGDVKVFNSSYIASSKFECEDNTIAVHMVAHGWQPRSPLKQLKYVIRMSRFYKYIKPLWLIIKK